MNYNDKNNIEKNYQPVLKNTFYLYLAHFSDYAISIIMLPFIARILGPTELGFVALAQTFGIFLLVIMEFGFSLTATREISRLNSNNKLSFSYISEVFTFKLLLIPLIIIFSIILILLFPIFNSRPHYIIFISIGSILQGLTPTWFFQGIEKIKIVAISKAIFRFLGFLIILIFIKNDHHGWIILFGYSMTSLFIFLYLFKEMYKIIGKVKFSSKKSIVKIWKSSKWIFLLTLIPIIFQNTSAFFLSSTLDPLKLGLYYGAFKIYRAFNTLYGPISDAIYPRLVSTKESSIKSSKILAKKTLIILFGLGIFFCVILFFFPVFFIRLLLGNEFIDGASTLKLFALVLPLTAVSNIFGRQWMLINNDEKKYSLIILINSVLAILYVIFNINALGIHVVPISLIIFEFFTIIMILLIKIKPLMKDDSK